MRTRGAKDKHKRKHRKDRIYKYVKRKGKFIPYKPTRKKGDPIKIWWWERVQMSDDGYKQWNKYLRPTIYRKTTRFGIRMDVNPDDISTREKIEQLASEYLFEGEWLMMGFSRGKTRTHIKPVKLCRVIVKDSERGFYSRMTNNYRLFRYWFWRMKK